MADSSTAREVTVPIDTLYSVVALLGQHHQRNPTWHGDRMCVCGNAPFPCNYAQARDKITEIIGD